MPSCHWFQELAKKLKPIKDIVIAKMDATANDGPDDYPVAGFPTIYFAPKNKKDSPIKFEQSSRELTDLMKFMEENGSVSLSSVKDEL